MNFLNAKVNNLSRAVFQPVFWNEKLAKELVLRGRIVYIVFPFNRNSVHLLSV